MSDEIERQQLKDRIEILARERNEQIGVIMRQQTEKDRLSDMVAELNEQVDCLHEVIRLLGKVALNAS